VTNIGCAFVQAIPNNCERYELSNFEESSDKLKQSQNDIFLCYTIAVTHLVMQIEWHERGGFQTWNMLEYTFLQKILVMLTSNSITFVVMSHEMPTCSITRRRGKHKA
jgi:hypothetical protein